MVEKQFKTIIELLISTLFIQLESLNLIKCRRSRLKLPNKNRFASFLYILSFTFHYLIRQYKMRKCFQNSSTPHNNQTLQELQENPIYSRKTCIQPYSNKMFHSIIFYFLIITLVPFATSQDYTNNLIVNGNFSEPVVNILYKLFSAPIPGWKCTYLCEIKNCIKGRKYWLPQHVVDSDCVGQVIDLNSDKFNEVATQKVDLTAGKYLLHFNYYYPAYSSRNKQLKVSFNNETLLYVHPQVEFSFDVFHYESRVQAIEGPNVLSFANLGLNDGNGFLINNVSLYRIIDTNVVDWLSILSDKVSRVNICPGFRVVFRNILSFLINFDRLELYIYHNRTYSYTIQQLLVAVNKLLDAKSNAAIKILQFIDKDTIESEDQFMNKIQFKDGYLSYPSFSPDYRNKSYVNNLNQSFIYFLPFVILLVFFLNIIFLLSFNSPISLTFRKFSLWAVTLLMIFDGNIENLTFFTLTEFKIFFSNCYKHKVLNVFILFIFFILIFIAFGLFHWGKFHYKKKVRFLLDEQHSNLVFVWGIIIDRGIVCFLFGALHCILLGVPSIQLICLAILEISWIIKKVAYVGKGLCSEKGIIYASVLSGCCRVCFQISCYIYDNYSKFRLHINEVVNVYLLYTIIGLSLLQFGIGFIYSLRGLFKICYKTDRVTDNFSNLHKLKDLPSKGKGIEKQGKCQQHKINTTKTGPTQVRKQRQNHKLGGQQQYVNRLGVSFKLRHCKDKPTILHADHVYTLQNEIVTKTRRTRMRLYYQ